MQELLDSQDTVFIWLKNKTKYSNIDADYLIVCKNHNNTFYLFVKKEALDKVRPISFFAQTNQDYTQGQIRTTLLRKSKSIRVLILKMFDGVTITRRRGGPSWL
ncbi:hypothetical protein D3Z38_04460 [Clostridiales bacterium]|nr:hypothetical protein [Clostridiales bacterium]